MIASDLGKLLKTKFQVREFRMLETYDLSPLWEIIIDRKEKFPSKSYANFIKNAQLQILHYFIASTLHGRSSNYSYFSFQDIWLMESAFNEIHLNVGRYMIEGIRSACLRDKAILPNGNIISTLVKKNNIWNYRFYNGWIKSKDMGIYRSSL